MLIIIIIVLTLLEVIHLTKLMLEHTLANLDIHCEQIRKAKGKTIALQLMLLSCLSIYLTILIIPEILTLF